MLSHIHDAAQSWQKSDIARMSIEEISRLNYDAMIDLVLASEMPVRNIERIHTFEGETVSRLVRMAQEHCRRTAATT